MLGERDGYRLWNRRVLPVYTSEKRNLNSYFVPSKVMRSFQSISYL